MVVNSVKKFFAVICAIVICISITGCDSSDYAKAKELANDGKYEEAITLFEKLDDYKDSADLVKEITFEKLAYDDCKTLQKMCRDPTSFMLYDDVYIYEGEYSYDGEYHDEGDDKTVVYISYGAKNMYGTMVTGFAIFDGTSYVGDWYDTEDDFSTQKAYDLFMLEYKLTIAWNNTQAKIGELDGEDSRDQYSDFICVSGEKLANLLGADFSNITGIRDLE